MSFRNGKKDTSTDPNLNSTQTTKMVSVISSRIDQKDTDTHPGLDFVRSITVHSLSPFKSPS